MISGFSAHPTAPAWLSGTVTADDARDAGRARRRNLPWAALVAWEGGLPDTAEDVVERIAADPQSGLACQLIGDPSIRFRSVDDRRDAGRDAFVTDVGELDDAVPGPWEWDVRIAAARIALSARSDDGAVRAVREFARAYRAQVRAASARDEFMPTDAVRGATADYLHITRGSRGDIVRRAVPHFGRASGPSDRAIAGRGIPAAGSEDDAGEVDSAEVLRWFAEYRENLPEGGAMQLADAVIVDAVRLRDAHIEAGRLAACPGDLVVLVRHGARRILLRAHRARPSVWPTASTGSDAQRVLLAGSLLHVVPDPLAGWCTDARRLGSVVWSTALAADGRTSRKRLAAREVVAARPGWWQRRHAAALGSVTGRGHAATVDVHALAGYLGGSTGFDEVLATSSLRVRGALRAAN